MKAKFGLLMLSMLVVAIFATGCGQRPNRRCYPTRGRKVYKSKHVASREASAQKQERLAFVPLSDEDSAGNQIAVNDEILNPPAFESPGDPGNHVPGPVVSCVVSPLLRSYTKICLILSAGEQNAIFVPSGDQAGAVLPF